MEWCSFMRIIFQVWSGLKKGISTDALGFAPVAESLKARKKTQEIIKKIF